jgi:hypothetical protein
VRAAPRALVVAVVAVLLAPAAAHAADEAVTIATGEGDPVNVYITSLPPDVTNTTYTVGSRSRTVTEGWSLDLALRSGQVDPYPFKSFEVSTGGEGGLLLSKQQVVQPSDHPPVFYRDEDGMHFIRPTGQDGSGGDLLSGNFTIRAKKETALAVKASADDDAVEVGDVVRFEAEPVSNPAGEDVTYKWVFGDGGTATGLKPRYRFKKRGSYSVLVQMTTPTDDVGASDIVRVKVGDAPETGPDREGGGTNESADAPTSGAADGAGGSGVAVGTSGGGSSSSDSSPSPSTSTPQREQAPRREREPKPAPPEPTGETVTGRLLSSTSPPVASPQREVAARTGTPRDNNEPNKVPEWVWAVLAVLALVGTGWAIDNGRLARLNWGTPSP